MPTAEEIKKQLATTEQGSSLQQLIEKSAKELGRALPDHMNPERLVRIALTSIRLNPELARCTRPSFLGALFTAAQIGLEPAGGRSYLIPFNRKVQIDREWKTIKEVQFVIGYKGLIELFYRHSASLSIDMQTVHEKDAFTYQHGTEPFLRHTPALKDRGGVIGYYSVAQIRGGGSVFHFMSREDVFLHATEHSKTWDSKEKKFNGSSPWAKEFDAMAMKTVLIQLSKRLPMSVEVQRAIGADETTRTFRPGVEPLDITPTEIFTEPEAPAGEQGTGEPREDA
jgi:recombination protein RecT